MNPYLSTMVAVLGLAVVALLSQFGPEQARWMGRLENGWQRFAQNRWVMVWLAAGIFIFSAGLHLVLKLPEPSIPDEFSYLLQADTFAHGRLANPPHAMAKFFENLHIIFHPTYASKYPPGQGLFLALGQILGRPIIGVWLSTALAGAAMFWMLSGIFPRTWALAGALIAFFNPQILMWNWNFWGGSVAWFGGALALGGAVRLWKTISIRPAIIMGLGMGILSLSRPYEGMILSLMLLFVCGLTAWQKSLGGCVFFRQCLWPAGCALLPFMLFQGWYNHAVTGSAFKLPYNVYDAAYSQTATFIWQPKRTNSIVFHNPQMAQMYQDWTYPEYDRQRSVKGFLTALPGKLNNFSGLVWDGMILAALVPLITVLGKKRNCRLLSGLLLAAFLTTFIGPVGAWPHYTAPFYPLLIALMIYGLREGRTWRWGGRRSGRWAVRGLVLLFCVYGCVRFFESAKNAESQWNFKRAEYLAQLEKDGNKHLVLVHYSQRCGIHQSWVWNRADIDRAGVVWATDLGEEQNRELLDYFKSYEVNRIEPTSQSPPTASY